MQQDFHYGVIKILCRAAGLGEQESQTAAYASQYLDDADRFQALPVEHLPQRYTDTHPDRMLQMWAATLTQLNSAFRVDSIRPLAQAGLFDPICTAHTHILRQARAFLQERKLLLLARYYKTLVSKETQLKIYLPFHFLPPFFAERYSRGSYPYCVQADSPLANEWLDTLIAANKSPYDAATQQLARIALGLALHTFADGWAHEGFSGRRNSFENNLKYYRITGSGEDMERNWFPNLGHAEARHYPDLPHIEVEYEFVHRCHQRQQHVRRANYLHFLSAAKAVYAKLLLLDRSPLKTWADLEYRLYRIFKREIDSQERIHALQEEFGDDFDPPVILEYDEKGWEHDAVSLSHSGDTSQTKYQPMETFFYHADAPWFQFHVAAAVQRTMLLRCIKKF